MAKTKKQDTSNPLDPNLWHTYDSGYKAYLQNPTKFRPKEGGAKHGGKRTGVYTFKEPESNDQLMMLIKQGDSVGETIAEYIGGNLYQLLIPDHSAKAILVRDNSADTPSLSDVYVTSIYEQGASNVQDAFKVAGYETRPAFARLRHEIKKAFGYKDESLIRKVLQDDQMHADNSLGYIMANVLWHGDHDVHMGNFVRVEKDGKAKYSKIDHGFSFFNFKKDVVDVFDPLGGKKVNFNLKRGFKGGKFIEWYPFNNFWDLAAEKKSFYFSGPFITGCEDIANLDILKIQANIHDSLTNVKNIYEPNAQEALIAFGKRMGMNKKDLDPKKSPDQLIQSIEGFMVTQLQHRQASINKLAQNCREQAAKLTDDHHILSREIGALIITKLDHIAKIQDLSKKTDITEHVTTYKSEKSALKKEIDFLKLLEQANDLGYLNILDGKLVLTGEFNYLNAGKKQRISPEIFQNKLINLVAIKDYNKLTENERLTATPLSTDGHKMLAKLISDLPQYKKPANMSHVGVKAHKQTETPDVLPLPKKRTIEPSTDARYGEIITFPFRKKIVDDFLKQNWEVSSQENITSLKSNKNPTEMIQIDETKSDEVVFRANSDNCIKDLIHCVKTFQESAENDLEYDIFAANEELATALLQKMLLNGLKKDNIGEIEINGKALDKDQRALLLDNLRIETTVKARYK